MKTFLITIAILAVLYALHRLARWMEDKGWIYYWKKRASPDALGNAALSIQQIVQPDTRHVLEAKQERTEQEHRSDPNRSGAKLP